MIRNCGEALDTLGSLLKGRPGQFSVLYILLYCLNKPFFKEIGWWEEESCPCYCKQSEPGLVLLGPTLMARPLLLLLFF